MAAFQRFLQASSSTLPRQCATAGFLFATGDCIAQQLIEKKGRNHDLIRTARLSAYGGLIFSPIMAIWFGKVLEKVPYKGTLGTVVKVGLDQGFAAPNMLALFFTATTLMQGKSTADVKEKLSDSYWSTLKTSWAVWIPVQTINMAFVPPSQRLLFVNVISIFWNTFLAVVAGGGAKEADKGEESVEMGTLPQYSSKIPELRDVKANKFA
ncbi:hypothetical protein CBS101457_002009 [Exobasidium rhododendri]|nr:hypothetical protein CBS101457_002009 [Exobasidium rhododendri]